MCSDGLILLSSPRSLLQVIKLSHGDLSRQAGGTHIADGERYELAMWRDTSHRLAFWYTAEATIMFCHYSNCAADELLPTASLPAPVTA